MNHRSHSVDYSHFGGRPHDYTRSWSVCEDYSYCPPPTSPTAFGINRFLVDDDDDDMPDPSVVYLQATSMDDKCGYRTGKCFNMRAMKRNGKDHKLCDFHRDKANQNQKKLDRKKRMKRCTPYGSVSSTTSSPRSSSCVAQDSLDFPFEYDHSNPSASPTRIDQAPEVLHFDEVAFFCDAMTPAEKLALAEAHAVFQHDPSPASDKNCVVVTEEANRREDLDLLFKAELMLFVDQL
ncbi:hypothetical protein B5M09_010315 [Aphanomyces astaci]|uniref:Uncharacterized protein n=1 Tax=Aphanomyces astaci TaxID=112090 RepID=A0A425DJW9_APHAT|nr:hypothetical protein B5M09_010315 [Aphanomyces astaci]